MENPCYQYSIDLSGYQNKPAFDTSALVLFRKRITNLLSEVNEYLPANKDEPSSSGSGGGEKVSQEEAPDKGCLQWMSPAPKPMSSIPGICPC